MAGEATGCQDGEVQVGVVDAERSLALARQAYDRFDIDAVVAHLSAAIRGFHAAGARRPEAVACLQLGDALAYGMGNLTAAKVWFARAERAVADEEPCVEQGWAALALLGCDVGDTDALRERAELALDRARRFGDLDLEMKALADGGLARVQSGDFEQGFRMLDEAMALACGPTSESDAAGKSACSFFTACYYSSEFDRADTWARLMRARGLLGQGHGAPAFLSNHCASLNGALLCELGRWEEAEELLVHATEQYEAAAGGPAFHTAIVLADLRIRQGRLDEAEQLLLSRAQAFDAQLPMARLHLARGDHGLAVACARRGVRLLGPDRLRAVELLAVVVEAEVGRGDLTQARAALAELEQRAAAAPGVPSVVARVAEAAACLCSATGDRRGAAAALESALDAIDPERAPWRRARLAAALEGLHDPAAPISQDATLTRTGRTWTASHGGLAVQVRDSKGIRHLAELIAAPDVEHHALDLVDRLEGVDPDRALDRRRLGDAGPVLDGRARDEYRRRIEELRDEIEAGLSAQRFARVEELQDEHDHLVRELAAAFGLGGRERTSGSAAERARLNVTRSIRTAITRLSEALPEAGAALDRSVRTGTYCAYRPADADLRWIVQPGVNGGAPD